MILQTHRRQHTGERPYSCVECQHHFTNWPNYNKHMKRRHGINKSVRIKSDNAVQSNQQISEEQVGSASADIEIPSFEDTLQPVTIETDKTMRLYDETTSQPYLLSHQGYSNTSGVQQQNILNAYYSMTSMGAIHQVMNPTSQAIDLMNTTLHR